MAQCTGYFIKNTQYHRSSLVCCFGGFVQSFKMHLAWSFIVLSVILFMSAVQSRYGYDTNMATTTNVPGVTTRSSIMSGAPGEISNTQASSSGGPGGITTGTSFGYIDANNEALVRILTRAQAFYDSATHQINLLQGNTPNPGVYLSQVIKKDLAHQRLILHANGQDQYSDGPTCVAQAAADFAAIVPVVSHENDTIPESNTNGGVMLEGEPYYHHTLQVTEAGLGPLVRLGQANADVTNPGYYLNIWITVAKGLETYAAWLKSGNTDVATCNQMNKMIGNCFLIFLREPFQ